MGLNNDYVGGHQSYWLASTQATGYAPMPGDTTVDVAIIGGGIAGLTTAMLLKEEGKRVAVVKANLGVAKDFVVDHLARAKREEVAPGEGCIVKTEDGEEAVY